MQAFDAAIVARRDRNHIIADANLIAFARHMSEHRQYISADRADIGVLQIQTGQRAKVM